jgi:hypothetical protein
MKSRKQFITEPGDRRWLEVGPRAAAAGGLVVVLLLGAMALLHPGERVAVDANRSTLSSASASSLPAAPPDVPATTLPPIATDADGFAAPDNHPPTF